MTSRRTPDRPRFVVEELEPRILYSADALAWLGMVGGAEVRRVDAEIATPASSEASASAARIASPEAQATAAHEIVFIDSRVPDAMRLVDDLLQQRANGRMVSIVTLNADDDGVGQIERALAGEQGLGAIHIISHGSAGAIDIGRTHLDASALASQAAALARWGGALAAGGDLLIYGCNVAEGEAGRLFLHELGALTGADIAASTNTTGAAAQGGDWTLEYSLGSVQTALAPSRWAQQGWAGVLATYTVTNTNDAGAGSLRQAIADANGNAGADTIAFNIGTGAQTISVASLLPDIIDRVTIDGSTQGGYAGAPLITLNGGATVQDGLRLYSGSDGSTVRGLVVQNFTQDGIDIAYSDGNTVAGNRIGTDAAGTAAAGNGQGVNIWAASNNVIGGTAPADRNVLSGNSGQGVYIGFATSTGNQVLGNHIGTTASGSGALGNSVSGVLIEAGAAGNTIGGSVAGAANVISGNGVAGVYLESAGNTVSGNLIGLNAAGGAKLANGVGVYINNVGGNSVGGTTALARNVISGNTNHGVVLTGASASGNLVQGNYIGTNLDGTAGLGNGFRGVYVTGGATGNFVGGTAVGAGNVLSGNGTDGIRMDSGGNTVQGNTIGLDAAGTATVGNSYGIVNYNASNTIGGTANGARNVISGNLAYGIWVTGASSAGTVLQGNWVGTNAAGTGALGNANGLLVSGGATNLTVGGTAVGAGNVISGNGGNGVELAASGITLQGNFIGLNAAGTAAVGNGDGVYINNFGGNTIGGAAAGARNVISGNSGDGIEINGEGADNNVVRGNAIGVSADGLSSLGNGGAGVYVLGGGDGNVIGGSNAGEGNWIVGAAYRGVEVGGASSGTVIQGNRIGTDASGTLDWGSGREGILLRWGATGTLVGGTTAGAANTVAYSGRVSAPEGSGIAVDAASTGNVILRNTLYGNAALGIDLGMDGVTADDAGDADTGANNLQNTLLLTSATTTGSELRLTGSFIGAPNCYYRVELYASSTADPSGHGEGQIYLGFLNMPVGASGTVIGSYTLPVAVVAGMSISATVTRTDAAYTSFVETSEFSNNAVALAPGITVSAISGHTSEAGGTASFSVVLDAAPTSAVTIAVGSGSTAEATVSTASLTFTTANWNVAQTVTVTGVDDSVVDGNRSVGIVLGAASSADSGYNGLDPADVTVTNDDNDTQSTIVVTTAADTADGDTSSLYALLNNKGADGAISLREALIAANNTANGSGGADRINFAIAGGGVQTLNLATALPTLSGAVVIDGYTQAGAAQNTLAVGCNAVLTIALRGPGSAGAAFNGLTLGAGSDGSTVRGLVIGNFKGAGIEVVSGGNTLAGNWIGLNSTGTAADTNADWGIRVNGSGSNLIGGSTAAARNVISGNTREGVYLYTGYNNTVQGNYIGTNAAGTAAVANAIGLQIHSNTGGNLVGGSLPGEGNLISGNTAVGVKLRGGGGNNTLRGNTIGLNAAGTAAIANATGIWLDTNTNNNRIGGVNAADANTISGNTGAGVVAYLSSGGSSGGNALLRNVISGNGGMGIDLSANSTGGDGVTANDTGDADSGPNGLQNTPVLASANSTGGNTTVLGSLNSTAGTSFRIEFFSSASGDASGHGEAQIYLGFITVTTDGSGNAGFAAVLVGVSVAAGHVVSATATVDLGGGNHGSTSEFAGNVVATAVPAGVTVSAISGNTTEAGGTATFSVVLDTTPTAAVTLTLSSSNTLEGSVSSSSLTFTSANWNVAQLVTVTGVQDHTSDGSRAYTIVTGAAASADASYNGLAVADVSVTNIEMANQAPVAIVLVPPGAANLVVNGSFELNSGAANTFTAGASVSGWTAVGGGIEVWNNYNNGPNPGPATASDGMARVELDADGGVNGIAQGVATSAGQTYVLTFDFSHRSGGESSSGVEVWWAGNRVATIGQNTVGWKSYSVTVTGTGGTDELRFMETVITNDGVGSHLDNARLVAAATPPLSVAENAANGTWVATAVGIDVEPAPAGTLVYSLTDSAGGRFAIDAATGAIRVANGSLLDHEAAASHAITVRITDPGALSYERLFSIGVTAVAEAPTGSAATVITAEDTPYAFNAADFGFHDGDTGDLLSAVRIDTLPGAGSLTLAGTAVTAGQVINVVDLPQLRFTPAPDAAGAGYASLSFSVRDTGGLFDTTPRTLSFDVSAVNDEQQLQANTGLTVNQRSTGVVITPAMLLATDIDNTAAQIVYTVTTAPAHGSLRLDGVLLQSGSTFSQADIAAGRLSYDHDGSAATADPFAFSVDDVRGAATEAVFGITLVDPNPPVITSNGGGSTALITVAENTRQVTTVTATDADAGTLLSFAIVGGTDAARFTIDAGTGALSWRTAPDFEAPGDADADNVFNVIVQASDGTRLAAQVIAVTVRDVNEAPTLSVSGVTVLAGQAVVLTTAMLQANDVDSSGANLLFTVSDLQNGRVERVAEPGTVIERFTQDDLAQGRVRLVTNAGSDSASLRVWVSDGELRSDVLSLTLVLASDPVAPGTTRPPEAAGAMPGSSAPVESTLPANEAAARPTAPVAATTPATAVTPSTATASTPAEGGGGAGRTLVASALGTATEASPPSAGRAVPTHDGVGATRSTIAATATAAHAPEPMGSKVFLDLLVNLIVDDLASGLVQMQSLDPGQPGRPSGRFDAPASDLPPADAPVERESSVRFDATSAQVAAAALTAGTVWWALRAGGLLTSLMVSLPTWRHVDLLAVLPDDDEDDEEGWDRADDAEATRDEQAVARVFEPAPQGES